MVQRPLVTQTDTQPQKIDRSSWTAMWLVASLLLLLPLWLFPYIPTQDGPAHLETAAHLLELKNSTFLQGFYSANWHLATNQLYHALLVGLGSFLPLLTAEKLLLSAYALLVPLTALFAVRGLKGAPLAAFLILPAVYSYIFYLGFYNLCFGLPLFLLALGLYFRLVNAPTQSFTQTFGLVVLLAFTVLLSYFVHVIAAANTLLALGILALLRLLVRGDRRTFGLSILAVLPTLAFVLFFFVQKPKTAQADTTNFLSFSQLLHGFFVHLPHPAYTIYSLLVIHTWLDLVFTLSLVMLMLGLVIFVLVAGIKARYIPAPELLVAFLVFFLIVFWSPNRLGEVGWLPNRFLPYGYALLVLWLSAFQTSARNWRVAAVTGLSVWGALMLYRLPVHAALSRSIGEYVSAAKVIDNNSTVLPLYLPSSATPLGLRNLYPNLRYDEARHALGYVAPSKEIVDLVDYQAAKDYFPIKYTGARSPVQYLGDRGIKSLENPPFAFDVAAYQRETGAAVDYVLFWGDLNGELERANVQAILRQLNGSGYRLIFTSKPQGLLHLYAREGKAKPTP